MSHFSFIPIHKCHFVKKCLKNTIIDTFAIENQGLKYIFFKNFVKNLLCVGCVSPARLEIDYARA